MSRKRINQSSRQVDLEKLKKLARPALEHLELVRIARSAKSPNAAFEAAKETAYELCYLETGDVKSAINGSDKLAKAVHALAKMRRDFPKIAKIYMSSVISGHPRQEIGTGKRKGENTMGTKKGTVAKEIETGKTETNVQPSIPLKKITYNVALNGAHARVRSIQEFTNDTGYPVEAVYVFPLPDEASVTACSMKIGRKTIKAELKGREQARQEYDQAVSAGNHGALMEQERPNIFTMNVGGIEPKETIKVEITYVQRIPWQDGGGRFRVPLVVAPRFIPGVPTGKQAGGWSPDTDSVPDASRITPNVAPEGVPYNASINVSFAPGFRCKLSSPSHEMLIQEQTVAKDDTVELKTGDIRTDRDFTLVYKSLSKRPEIAVFQNAGKDESVCLVNILPPGDAVTVPSDVVFLLDISGSMSGAKLDGLKKLAKKVLTKIRNQELGHRVSIIAFESSPHLLVPMSEISDLHLQQIDKLRDMGGTEMGTALTAAHQQLNDSSRPRIIFLISDGQAEFGMRYNGQGARIITAGIDSAVNDSTLKQLAQSTGGTYVNYFPGEDFDRAANNLIGMLSGPVLRDIKVEGQGEVAGLTDVFVGQPATIALRFKGELPAEIKISGQDPSGQEQSWTIKPKTGKDCGFAPQIWAREAIRETPDKTKQVQFSLKYGVICSGTSFVAISEKEVPGQKPVKVEIPVNLPQGWDYAKIFGQQQPAHLAALYACAPTSVGALGLTSKSSRSLGFMDRSAPVEVDDMMCCFEAADCCPEDDMEELCEDDDFEEGGGMAVLDGIEDADDDRFTLDAADKVDRLIAILITVAIGRRDEAEAAFDNLKLTVKEIESWSDEKRAMALYFVERLRAYSLRLNQNLMAALREAPKNSPEAQVWRFLAIKESGLAPGAIPTVSGNMDGADYAQWKINPINPRPTDGWAIVP